MRARDYNSIFSTGGKFRPDYGLLLELHALTLVARSYALLLYAYECDQAKGGNLVGPADLSGTLSLSLLSLSLPSSLTPCHICVSI